VKPVFKVSLASGRSIRATAEHRLFGPNGWVTVGELRPGSRLACFDVAGAAAERAFMENIGAIGSRAGSATQAEAMFVTVESNTAVATLQGKAFAPSRAMIEDYAEKLGDPSLRRWSDSDIFWDRVVAVEPDGEEQVFDLTVPGPSCWLADGIVSHNSGALEQDADMIFFIYRDEVYNEESPDKGIAEVIIGKQRNGPIGTVKLTFLGKHTRFENYSGAPGGY